MDLGLRAVKIATSKCVEVKWNKAESGACYVKYEVVLRNASGSGIRKENGYNIGEMMMCNLPSTRNITNVQLTVSFKATSKNATANVTEAPLSTKPPTVSGMRLISKALAKRSRLFTMQRSTCMLSEMLRAFGHLVE